MAHLAATAAQSAKIIEQKRVLRKQLRKQRALISTQQRRQAALRVAQRIRQLPAYRASQRVGIYLHSAAELPTDALEHQNHAFGKQNYAPIITALHKSAMMFGQTNAQTRYRRNHLGIVQPLIQRNKLCRALALDIIFLPLLGFDANCNRLGMGMGFYDRFLTHRLHLQHFKRPIIIGLAFDEQQLTHVPHNQWDVPLDAVITPSVIIHK